jgi:hypothetical protein
MREKGLAPKRAIVPADTADTGGNNGRTPTAPPNYQFPRMYRSNLSHGRLSELIGAISTPQSLRLQYPPPIGDWCRR